MHRLYRLLIWLVSPFCFAYFWRRGRKAPAYRRRWEERLALQSIPVQARESLLIHCVSVGEVIAARALIEDILSTYSHLQITVTATTPTGSALLRQAFGNRIYHCYLPLDTGRAMRRFLNKLAPRAVLLLETELWPNFLWECKARYIPVGLVNARLSARSARGYAKLRQFGRDLWQSFSFVAAQTPATARRVRWLGVEPERISVCGNLKQDFRPPAKLLEEAEAWRAPLAERPIIVAGSTHAGEEEAVLAAFETLLEEWPELLLILVPRHPERFASVTQWVKDQGFTVALRSKREPVTPNVQVVVGNTMGELVMWYAAADAAFIGGSLVERGGHNPLEAIAVDTPVLSGPHVFNFAEIYRSLARKDAVINIEDAAALAAGWRRLLSRPDAAKNQAARAQAVLNADRGALSRMLDLVKQLLPAPAHQGVRSLATTETCTLPDQTIWFDPIQLNLVGPEHFSPHYWRERGAIQGAAVGRNTAWFIHDQDQQLLLRHYYRGGLVGKINKDRFLREPAFQSRGMREYALLLRLRELGLPVPEPVAARMAQSGLTYRADIIVRIIPQSTDVFQLLRQRQLLPEEWHTLGQTIRQVHDANVYHSDLNCHNLLLDQEGKAWLVDFDKCGFRPPGKWKQANLDRLLRSLRKEQAKHPVFNWQEADWQPLVAGYREGVEGGRSQPES